MKYLLRTTARFEKDVRLAAKRGRNMEKLTEVIEILASGAPLPARNKDHALSGDYSGCRECHIEPDWLLIYEIVERDMILYLTRTGTHSDLF